MNKHINLNLYKSLLESDFILLNNTSFKAQNYVVKEVGMSSKQKISTLNVLQLVKSLKQLIRLFQFLKTQKNAGLHIVVANKQHFFLLKEYLLTRPLKFKINVQNSALVKKSGDATQMLFSFEQDYSTGNTRILKRLLSENIFLIQKINSKIEVNNWGAYKLYNDSFDFKKIVFLIALFEQSLFSSNN